jgi:hypothetical protein
MEDRYRAHPIDVATEELNVVDVFNRQYLLSRLAA